MEPSYDIVDGKGNTEMSILYSFGFVQFLNTLLEMQQFMTLLTDNITFYFQFITEFLLYDIK